MRDLELGRRGISSCRKKRGGQFGLESPCLPFLVGRSEPDCRRGVIWRCYLEPAQIQGLFELGQVRNRTLAGE